MNTYNTALRCVRCKKFLCWSESNTNVMCDNCTVRENRINLSVGHRGDYKK